jgi:hypothetical protein
MRRSVFAVVVVCLLAVFPAGAATYEDGGRVPVLRGKDGPFTKIVRVIKQTIRSFGDGLGGPKP